MKLYKIIFLLTCLEIGIFSCNKQHTHGNDTQKPFINIAEPLLNDTITLFNDTVHISFSVQDEGELHEIMIDIRDTAGTTLYVDSKHVDAESFYYDEHFIPTGITGITQMLMTVSASDHSENIMLETRSFFVKP
jgi:hypothetical protein